LAPVVEQPIINGVEGQPEIIDIKEEPIEMVNVAMAQPFVAPSFEPTYSVEKPKVKNYAKTFGIVSLILTIPFVLIVGIPLMFYKALPPIKDSYVIMGNDKVPTLEIVFDDLKNYGVTTSISNHEYDEVTIKYLKDDLSVLEKDNYTAMYEYVFLFDKIGEETGKANFLLQESVDDGKVIRMDVVQVGTDNKYVNYVYQKIDGSLDDYEGTDMNE